MPSPVLILGAGINGAAIARELVLQRIPVIVVDKGDIASGATAYSSRLIHGGLRYLEYGEFDLVRESLQERTYWLQHAPDFVKPMRFVIPVETRFGGLQNAAGRFLNLPGWMSGKPAKKGRGLYTVRMGLKFYDIYARDKTLPVSCVLHNEQKLPLNPSAARWQCEYSDAQMLHPERFTVALFQDAAKAAAENGTEFKIYPYHHVELQEGSAILKSLASGGWGRGSTEPPEDEVKSWQPPLIINSTGAWLDQTLTGLQISSKQLLAGTKGSHFLTSHSGLCAALRKSRQRENEGGWGRGSTEPPEDKYNASSPRAVYAEASDGRPVFVIPFADRVLVGTTDEPFHGDPADAIATPQELEYLVNVVNHLFPDVRMTMADVEQHYCGVRPLPFVGPSTPAAVTRRHWVESNEASPVPLFSIIGGKLTTCRSLAKEVAEMVCGKLNCKMSDRDEPRQITNSPTDQIREVIRNEWVSCLEDLTDRRLMLVFEKTVNCEKLVQLAKLLVEVGKLSENSIDIEVERVIEMWQRRYGKKVAK